MDSKAPPERGLGERDSLHLDFDVDAGGEVEVHEGVDGFGGRVGDVDEALVGSHFELLAGVLVDVRAAQDRHRVFLGG